MTTYKKAALVIVGTLGSLLLLLLICLLLLPKVLNLNSMKEKILARVSSKTSAEATYEKIDISLFPLPHVVIHKGSFVLAGKIGGTFESISFYPEILPLLSGKIRLSTVNIEEPDVNLKLPEKTEKKEDEKEAPSLSQYLKILSFGLSEVASKAHRLVFDLERGKLRLFDGDKPVYSLSDINASIEFPTDQFNFDISFKSNIAKRVSSSGSIDLKEFKSNGDLEVVQFKPQELTEYLLPNIDKYLAESIVDLKLSFKTDGPTDLLVGIKASIPNLTLINGEEKLVIKGKNLQGDFHMDKDIITVSLDKLNLDNPQLDLSGKLSVDQTSHKINMELKGKDVDVHSTRESALTMLGKSKITRKIFEVVRGGQVPLITFTSSGNSFSELGKDKNFVLKGQMRNGEIFIPQANLDLKNVNGFTIISKGILEGENLEANLGNSQGFNGNLTLGLSRKNDVFKLAVEIKADLSELPPYLIRFIKNESFQKEIALVNNLSGSALGHLDLGDTKSSIKPKVDLSEFNLSANYPRLPYPVEIKGDRFLYDNSQIDLKNLSVNLAESSFSGINGLIDWEETSDINIKAGKSTISLEEILPWISSFEEPERYINHLKSLNGMLTISSLNFNGPLAHPTDWDFQIKGEGNLNEQIGPKISFNLEKKADEFLIDNLIIEDEVSNASIKLNYKRKKFDLNFEGDLTQSTLNNIFANKDYIHGWIKGNILMKISLNQPANSTAEGELSGERLHFPLLLKEPIEIKSFSLEAKKDKLNVDSLDISVGDNNFSLNGDIAASSEGFQLDLDASTDKIRWQDISETFQNDTEGTEENENENFWNLPVKGTIRLKSESFYYDILHWKPFKAKINLKGSEINVEVTDANLCGIATPGDLKATPDELKLDFKPVSKNQDLYTTISCLTNKEKIASGNFDLEGEIKGHGIGKELTKSLNGNINFVARNGRIYKDQILLKILKVTEIFRGRLPDFGKEGFSYNSIKIKGNLQNGKLTIQDAILDSPSIAIVGDGVIDLVNKKLNVALQVAPLKAVSYIVEKIPLVKRIRGGHLLSIPVKIKGDLSDPEVSSL